MASSQPAAQAQSKRILTTVEIQQMLEENAKLISAIVENQNMGRLEPCIEYQKRLQQNLMSLAALADSQAQPQQQPSAGGAPGGAPPPQ